MALSLLSMFNSTAGLYRLKLLAGRKGIHHPVSWMYYTEDTSTIDFIRGGELALTTGMNIERTKPAGASDGYAYAVDYLTRLITCLHELDAAGLIINTGKYINVIPEEIEILCDTLHFPLFSMPWEIHIVDIMQDYGNRIVSERQKRKTVSELFYNALFNPQKFDAAELGDTSFDKAVSYGIVLLELPEELFRKSDDELFRYIDYSFNARLDFPQSLFCWFIHDHKVVYVFHDNPEQPGTIISRISSEDRYFHLMKTAVSATCPSPAGLFHEYEHAVLALRFCREGERLSCYSRLGIFKLLSEIPDRKVLEQYYEDILGKLAVLGSDKRADYLKTLKLYIDNSCKVAAAAQENSTHRNTVNYRIHKLKEILGADLDDAEVRYRIRTALYIRELIDRTK
jgi:PucR family transcriptional regulator, proline-responsive transcriptional activator